jgi:maltose alpha-D-glucosyltransferase/alpha-amylase
MKLTYSLMFGLPGTPVIRYGEETGGRSTLASGTLGHSHADAVVERPQRRVPDCSGGRLPVIDQGPFGYKQLNVAGQQAGRASFLQQIKALVARPPPNA